LPSLAPGLIFSATKELMMTDSDKPELPAHQGGIAKTGKNPTIPRPPAKPITAEVLDPGAREARECHERHKRHRGASDSAVRPYPD
jgi:hypothetical protein